VCQEDLFSSRDASHELPCGHAIHWHCFRQLAGHDSRCPICKKTAETHDRMRPTWDAMAMGIALQVRGRVGMIFLSYLFPFSVTFVRSSLRPFSCVPTNRAFSYP